VAGIARLTRREFRLLSPEEKQEREWAQRRVAQAKYERTDKGRHVRRKYETSEKGRIKLHRYINSANGIKIRALYREDPRTKLLVTLIDRTPYKRLMRRLQHQARKRMESCA
jgi:hypothetical protein